VGKENAPLNSIYVTPMDRGIEDILLAGGEDTITLEKKKHRGANECGLITRFTGTLAALKGRRAKSRSSEHGAKTI